MFLCTYPGCRKSFTRPYDLKKHIANQHQGFVATAVASSATVRRASAQAEKRGIDETVSNQSREGNGNGVLMTEGARRSDVSAPEVGPKEISVFKPRDSDQCMGPFPGLSNQPMQAPLRTVSSTTPYRKRIRCEAHRHHDAPVAPMVPPVCDGGASTVPKGASAAVPGQHNGPHGGKHSSKDDSSRPHVHRSSCGHKAVLHDDHIDFVHAGNLECFGGKEVGELMSSRH